MKAWVGWVFVLLAVLIWLFMFRDVVFGQAYNKAQESRAEKWAKPEWVSSFLYLYDQYQDSCAVGSEWKDSLEWLPDSGFVVKRGFKHQEPTFNGFMDFLKRRYK